MPNKRAAGIVNVSFTMPAAMAERLEAMARRDLTNKSEIVRRAIMNFLTPAEVEAIRSSAMNDAPNNSVTQSQGQVTYPKGKSKKS